MAALIASSRAMFSGDEMIAPTRWLPSVVGPALTSSTRSDAAATRSKYSRIRGQDASFASAPIRKPKNDSGDGISWA